MKCFIYAFDTAEAAWSAIALLCERGVPDKHISIVTRRDSELDEPTTESLGASADLIPAPGWGAVIGAAAGVSVGLTAISVLPLGAVIGSSMLLAFLVAGAILGAWMSAPIGSNVPVESLQVLENEVEAGRTLVMVDSDGHDESLVTTVMAAEGDRRHLLWQSIRHTSAVGWNGAAMRASRSHSAA